MTNIYLTQPYIMPTISRTAYRYRLTHAAPLTAALTRLPTLSPPLGNIMLQCGIIPVSGKKNNLLVFTCNPDRINLIKKNIYPETCFHSALRVRQRYVSTQRSFPLTSL
jgi:hypothetical protein